MSKSIKTLILIFISFNLASQNANDFVFANNLLPQIEKQSARKAFNEEVVHNDSEIEVIFSGLFLIYKEFFSSQDYNSCSFHPSCSLYGIQSIKQKGLIKGGVLTLDRLTRCNGFSPEKYEIDYDRRILLDPVK